VPGEVDETTRKSEENKARAKSKARARASRLMDNIRQRGGCREYHARDQKQRMRSNDVEVMSMKMPKQMLNAS
jgi:hypothetical protein